MKKVKEIFKLISEMISWTIIILLITFGLFLVFIFTSSKFSQKAGKESPVGLYTIISPSMTPNVNVYDVVFSMQTSSNNMNVGDIITFISQNPFLKGTPVTHRIVKKTLTNMGYKFTTKGDGNDAIDHEEIFESEVVGKVYFKIPSLGRVQFWLQNQQNKFIIVLVPALLVVSYQIWKLLKYAVFKTNIDKEKKPTIIAETKVDETKVEDIKVDDPLYEIETPDKKPHEEELKKIEEYAKVFDDTPITFSSSILPPTEVLTDLLNDKNEVPSTPIIDNTIKEEIIPTNTQIKNEEKLENILKNKKKKRHSKVNR
ncbi:MAG: signal peptidase I [Bacilli bacterium]